MSKVCIIGAGILGAAAAYELTLKGHDVIIVDNYEKGRATSAAAGIICPWISKRRNKAWYALAKGGAAYYPALIAKLHKDGQRNTGYKKVGAIKLHDDVNKLKELEEIALQRKLESPEMGDIHILNQEETYNRFPYLTKDFHSLSISGAARVDGNALRNALLEAAKKRGASIMQGEASLEVLGKRITGIAVGENSISSDVTIATNGVWMNELLEPVQNRVRFQAQKGELLHLTINNPNTTEFPVVMPPNNQYILPLECGKIIVGATHQTVHQFDSSLTTTGTHYILEELFKIAPSLHEASISDSRVGFRPFTKNHLPVFGTLPDYEGLLIANGLGASGLTTGPFIGKQLAKIVSGESTDVPLSEYRITLAE